MGIFIIDFEWDFFRWWGGICIFFMGIYFELVGFEFNLLLKVVMFLVVFFFVKIIFELDDWFGFGRIIGGVGLVL